VSCYYIDTAMISQEDLQKTYSAFSTDELLAIVRQPGDYTQLAVSVAKEELAKRNVTEDQELDFDKRVEQAKTIALRYASEELSIGLKFFFYFIWIPLLHFAVKQNLREGGFRLKVQQAGYYSIAGFITFVITALVSTVLNLTDWPAGFVWALLIVPALFLDKYVNKKPTSL
jgi:hypothetical protein